MIPKTPFLRMRLPTSLLSKTPLRRTPLLLPTRRTFKSTSIHHNTPPQQQQQQPPPQTPERPTTSSFKPFYRPFFKVFLGAIFTYQVWYWAWTKLEMDELKAEKQEELSSLEKKAREMASSSS